MNDIEIHDVFKSFGDKKALEGISTVFPGGSVSCIMGESGCGKTTLLNILLGLSRPDSGSISGLPSLASAVFQEDRLCVDFSVRTNVRITARAGTTPQDISLALAALGLEGNEKTPVRELSGGMKRRVALARALLADGELIILDEPFTGLDEANRDAAAEFILNNRRGRTVIFVTHDKSDIARMGAVKVVEMGRRG